MGRRSPGDDIDWAKEMSRPHSEVTVFIGGCYYDGDGLCSYDGERNAAVAKASGAFDTIYINHHLNYHD